MSINEILIVSAFILLLIDIFFVSDYPTHVAYFLIVFAVINTVSFPILYEILFGVLIWFGIVVFHYLVYRKIIEKFNNKFIAPTKHVNGLENLQGREGLVKEINKKKVMSIDEEIYQFESSKKIVIGKKYKILSIKSNKLVI